MKKVGTQLSNIVELQEHQRIMKLMLPGTIRPSRAGLPLDRKCIKKVQSKCANCMQRSHIGDDSSQHVGNNFSKKDIFYKIVIWQ